MSDNPRQRRPFGHRDEKEKAQPFGSRPSAPRPQDPQEGVSPTDPYSWADEDKKPVPPPDPNAVPPTAPYPWADEEKEKPAPPPDPNAIPPTAPYPWSDEAAAVPSTELPPSLSKDDDVDPGHLSWAELLAGVEGPQIAPPEVEAFDEAPPEPPLASEVAPPERVKAAGGMKLLPTEKEAPPERVTDRFLARGSVLKRRRPASIPATSYLDGEEGDAARPPVTIRIVPMLRTLGAIVGSGLLVATLLTWWTPGSFLSPISAGQLAVALATQSGATSEAATPNVNGSNSIGIVSGHKGINPTTGLPDPGAVCADGLTEESVNETISVKTAQLLESAGYHVDVFDEFDPRLQGYIALAMVSIHADSCQYVNDQATGFKVAGFASASRPDEDQKLVTCLINRYASRTGLPLHASVTYDMTDYHNFREIDPRTPGAIIETGFLYLDRNFLTQHPDEAARGIVDGILCYVRGEQPASVPASPPAPATPSETAAISPTPSQTPTEGGPLFDTVTPADTPVPSGAVTTAP